MRTDRRCTRTLQPGECALLPGSHALWCATISLCKMRDSWHGSARLGGIIFASDLVSGTWRLSLPRSLSVLLAVTNRDLFPAGCEQTTRGCGTAPIGGFSEERGRRCCCRCWCWCWGCCCRWAPPAAAGRCRGAAPNTACIDRKTQSTIRPGVICSSSTSTSTSHHVLTDGAYRGTNTTWIIKSLTDGMN